MEAILDVRFTDPAAALYVDIQSDSIESLFAISTSRVPGAPTPPAVAVPSQVHPAGSSGSAQVHVRKRPREDSAAPRHRTPAKVVERVGPSIHPRRVQAPPPPPPPPSMPSHAPQGARLSSLPMRQTPEEPLFLPESQMSAADREALHASGLGDMDADEFNAMMEDEGEEVGLNLDPWGIPPPPSPAPVPDIDLDERGQGQNVDLFEDDIEESEMGPTQSDENGKVMSSLGPPSVVTRANVSF